MRKILPIKVRRRTMSKLLREIKLATIPFEPKSISAIKNEVLPIDEVAIHILNKLDKYYNNILKNRYGVDHVDEDLCVTYDAIGKKIGARISGGEIDYDRVSTFIVNDMKQDVIKFFKFDRL